MLSITYKDNEVDGLSIYGAELELLQNYIIATRDYFQLIERWDSFVPEVAEEFEVIKKILGE